LPPSHAPEAEQESAFVEVQTSVAASPLITDAGFAASDTVGAGGAGEEPLASAGAHCGCSVRPQAASASASTATGS